MFAPSRQIEFFEISDDFRQSSSEALPAKTSAAQTPKAKASKARAAASTSKPSASSESAVLVGSLLRTALISELGALTPSSLRWKHSATPAGRSWFVLETSAPITSGPEAGSSDATSIKLPTPIAGNSGSNQGGGMGRTGPIRHSTKTMIRQSLLALGTSANTASDGLGPATNATKLPTPVKNDRKMEPWSEAYARRRSPKLDALMDGAAKHEMMPTPLKSDRKGSLGVMSGGKVKSQNVPTFLRDQKWDYARQIAAALQSGGLTGPSMTLPVTYNWMMGFPPGWLARALRSAVQKGLLQQVSSSKRSGTPSFRKSQKQ
jgi:hypothetical protein